MTERWCMALATIMTLGSGRCGMARRLLMDAVLANAGRHGAVGALTAVLAGAVVGDLAASAGAAAIHRPRGGEVFETAMTTMATGGEMAVAAIGLTPAGIYIIMGSLSVIVSTPLVGNAEPATSAMLTIRGQANSPPGSIRGCETSPAAPGIRAGSPTSRATIRSLQVIAAGWPTPIIGTRRSAQ